MNFYEILFWWLVIAQAGRSFHWLMQFLGWDKLTMADIFGRDK